MKLVHFHTGCKALKHLDICLWSFAFILSVTMWQLMWQFHHKSNPFRWEHMHSFISTIITKARFYQTSSFMHSGNLSGCHLLLHKGRRVLPRWTTVPGEKWYGPWRIILRCCARQVQECQPGFPWVYSWCFSDITDWWYMIMNKQCRYIIWDNKEIEIE